MKTTLTKLRAVTRGAVALLQIALCFNVLYLIVYGTPDLAWHWSYLAIPPLAAFVFWPVGRGHYTRYG
ncbi:hypothetical protein [Paraburkholderia sp. J12]|uniref:hypothetical protein n=1 Tax=Paraburkholderia sp. J12 TaxID=2805432 RepID=UPI002ABE265F|nr:hypothetical protein [Paraburkholderia sp. J12]